MRAATTIVGAVAAASILIALAFILSGGGGSSQSTTTRTIVETVKAPERQPETEEPAAQETGAPQFGGPTPCDKELSVENVSCEVGTEIHERYEEGGRGELFAEDKEADESITMTCKEGTSPITCTGPGGAKVYFGN